MQMRNKDIEKMLNGKSMTGRAVDFKIRTDKWHKVISDRKKGSFGEIFVTGWFIAPIGKLTQVDLRALGYSSAQEYLAEPFNKGLTEKSCKKFICWNRFNPNWEVLAKFGYFQEYDEADYWADYYDAQIEDRCDF